MDYPLLPIDIFPLIIQFSTRWMLERLARVNKLFETEAKRLLEDFDEDKDFDIPEWLFYVDERKSYDVSLCFKNLMDVNGIDVETLRSENGGVNADDKGNVIIPGNKPFDMQYEFEWIWFLCSNPHKFGLSIPNTFAKFSDLTCVTIACFNLLEHESSLVNLSKLPLEKLSITCCYLNKIPESFANLKDTLTTLDLSRNRFNSSTDFGFENVGKLTKIVSLNVVYMYCVLYSYICQCEFSCIENLCDLKTLKISGNGFDKLFVSEEKLLKLTDCDVEIVRPSFLDPLNSFDEEMTIEELGGFDDEAMYFFL